MKKGMTPVIAIVLLISMTVFAAAMSYFWISSVQSSVEERVGTSVESAPGTECTRLNIISVRGDKAVVQNVGCDNVTELNVLINGRLTKYTLDDPLAPGESTVITYSPQAAGEELTVEIVGKWGSSSVTSPADENTEEAGFTSSSSSSSSGNPLHTSSASITVFDGGMRGYCNAYSDENNNILRYNYTWKNGNSIIVSNLHYPVNSIVVNINASCGILSDGSAICWGKNDVGQLGNGSIGGYTSTPDTVSGSYSYKMISSGIDSTVCAILTNGSAVCWGENNYGQVGDNSLTDRENPSFVYGNYIFKYISAGDESTCGILEDGRALCWGNNDEGELGDGTTAQSLVPVSVEGNYKFSVVSVGFNHACGVLTNGSAVCWGENAHAELGNGSAGGYSTVPVFVDYDKKFESVSAGYTFSCGLLTNGSAVCWGNNAYGNLGNGSTGGYGLRPSVVKGGYNFSDVTAHLVSCGLLTNGSAVCWGMNNYGQLGDGTTTNRNEPVLVSGNYNFSKIAGGDYHTCGILTNGTALCWGKNDVGQLGNGSEGGYSTVPLFVSGSYRFYNNSAYWNKDHLVSILPREMYESGDTITFECSVASDSYQSSSKDDSDSTSSNLVVKNVFVRGDLSRMSGYCNGYSENSNDLMMYNVSWYIGSSHKFSAVVLKGGSVSAGSDSTCGLLINGSAVCWGSNEYGQLGNSSEGGYSTTAKFVSGGYNFSKVDTGGYHACGMMANGSVLCWGRNTYGQVGDGTDGNNKNSPTFVSGTYKYVDISSGNLHSCGITEEGHGMCWGNNEYGQLGDGTTTNRNTPTAVSGSHLFIKIVAGIHHTCGIVSDGSAYCWGDNSHGQIGNGSVGGSATAPDEVGGGYKYSDIAVGYVHSCGLLTNGSVVCWGDNTYAQLGNGSVGGESSTPKFVDTDYTFVAISGGMSHTCGVMTNGSVVCWGYNYLDKGELGNGSAAATASSPVFIDDSSKYTSISSLAYHSCGVHIDGSAYCWGDNEYGKLGDGTTTQRDSPVQSTSYTYYNNTIYWNNNTIVSILPSYLIAPGDSILFRCKLFTENNSTDYYYSSKAI